MCSFSYIYITFTISAKKAHKIIWTWKVVGGWTPPSGVPLQSDRVLTLTQTGGMELPEAQSSPGMPHLSEIVGDMS